MRLSRPWLAAGLAVVLCGASAVLPAAARADALPPEECDVQVDTRLKVYTVMVGSEVFQDKRYLTWDDALNLRDVLVSAGACSRAAPPKPCKLTVNGSGTYEVFRDGVNFDPYAKLGNLDAARAYARKLEKFKLCKPVG